MADSFVVVKMENLNTGETGDLMLLVPSGTVAKGTSLPMALKDIPESGSPTTWVPEDKENWVIRDIIQDGTIMGGIIRLMRGTSPTALSTILTSNGPTNPGRPKFAQVIGGGAQYSFQVVAAITH